MSRLDRRSPMMRLLLLGALTTLLAAPRARAEDRPGDLERKVKAAFLYKFAGYVEWPAAAFPEPETPLVIGVLGDEAMAEELAKLVAGRTSAGRPVSILRVRSGEPLPAIHLLFIGRSEDEHLRTHIRAVAGRPILVVTESEGALAQGSMVNFVLARARVRFEVNLAAVEPAGLSLSSRLLSVAQTVLSGTP